MTVNLQMLRRIDQGEEVEAADGAVGGDRRGGLIFWHGGSFKAGALALQQTVATARWRRAIPSTASRW